MKIPLKSHKKNLWKTKLISANKRISNMLHSELRRAKSRRIDAQLRRHTRQDPSPPRRLFHFYFYPYSTWMGFRYCETAIFTLATLNRGSGRKSPCHQYAARRFGRFYCPSVYVPFTSFDVCCVVRQRVYEADVINPFGDGAAE